MKKYKLGFIGTGKMATAIIKGILAAKVTVPGNIVANDKYREWLEKIAIETGIRTADNNAEVVSQADIIFLCVKPNNIKEVLEEIKDKVTKEQLVISIAAGVTLSKLESVLSGKRVVRVMPNTPCLVGEMAAGFTMGKNTTADDEKTMNDILNSIGLAFRMKDESLLDAVTGLSGSGPAFFAYIINAFKEAGVKQGLDEETALKLAEKTCLGTAKLLLDSEQNLSLDKLIEIVSSPNGTTIAGRKVLENSELKKIISDTVEAATKRSKELGEKGN